jgi:peptide/nickel transport system substrate-binding protein
MKNRVCFGVLIAVLGLCCISFPAVAAERPLIVVAPWKAKGLDMHKSGFIFSRMGVVEMLTTTDDSGEIVGQLANSWQVSPDLLTWTFSLKPGISFHDQTPLTAEAVSKCLRISLANKGALSKAKVAAIDPVGPLTLTISTERPFSSLPAHLAHYSAGIIAPASFDDHNKVVQPYGTGQFIFVKNEGNTRLLFKANHSYWGEDPQVENAEYQAVPKGETRGFMIKSGQADMAFTLTPSDAKQLKTTDNVRVETLIIPRSRILVLNCSLPLFSDIRVRRAMSMAIDRQGIANGLLRSPDSAATQLLAPAVSVWHDKGLAPLTYDPEGARKLLTDAGWALGSDGILEKDGTRFQFELSTYGARPMLPPIAAALQQQFRKFGIEMQISVGESSQIPDKHSDGTLQAALVARNFGLIPDAIGTIYGDFGPQPGGWGPLGWQSPQLNQLLKDYLAEFNGGAASDIRKQCVAILQDELPDIPITWYEHIVAVSRRIEGVHIDPFEIKSYIKGVRWAK